MTSTIGHRTPPPPPPPPQLNTATQDLLEKMMKVDPDEATEEERREGITKLRYMTFREVPTQHPFRALAWHQR